MIWTPGTTRGNWKVFWNELEAAALFVLTQSMEVYFLLSVFFGSACHGEREFERLFAGQADPRIRASSLK